MNNFWNKEGNTKWSSARPKANHLIIGEVWREHLTLLCLCDGSDSPECYTYVRFSRNHPIIKDDGVLTVFLSEPSFEAWRKHTPISLDEESVSKRVDRMEEMSIPSDLEEKLA
jgi:uncharacterized protein (DUF779 family)